MSQAGLVEFGSFYGTTTGNSKAAAVLPSALCDPVKSLDSSVDGGFMDCDY